MSEVEEKVRSVLDGSQTLYLSTAAASGEPWAAGAFFAPSDLFTLGLVLELTGKTLANIKTNRRAAVIVSSGSPFDVFLQGLADVEIVDDEAGREDVKQALLSRAPQIEPFFGIPLEAVRLRLRSWRATDVPAGWLPGKELQAPGS